MTGVEAETCPAGDIVISVFLVVNYWVPGQGQPSNSVVVVITSSLTACDPLGHGTVGWMQSIPELWNGCRVLKIGFDRCALMRQFPENSWISPSLVFIWAILNPYKQ